MVVVVVVVVLVVVVVVVVVDVVVVVVVVVVGLNLWLLNPCKERYQLFSYLTRNTFTSIRKIYWLMLFTEIHVIFVTL